MAAPRADPFDTIKLRLQCSPPDTYRGPLDCLLRTIRQEGPRALYKGASPPAFGWAVSDALLFGSLHNYRLRLEKWETGGKEADGGSGERLSLKGHVVRFSLGIGAEAKTDFEFRYLALAGGDDGRVDRLHHHHTNRRVKRFARFPRAFPPHLSHPPRRLPTQTTSAKLQMQTIGPKIYAGPIDCARQIVRHTGVAGLWHGFGGTLLFRSWFGVMYVPTLSSGFPFSVIVAESLN